MTAPEPTVLYGDGQCLVAVKPAGLPSVPGRTEALQDCLSRRVQQHTPDALVVHRLDMATSGLMLFARGATMQRVLSAAFAERRVHKTYTAVVAGLVADDSGSVTLPLRADWPNRPRQVVDTQAGKPSLTHYRVLARQAGCTRLQLEPVTGRSHQLRVHLQALGHPILGDMLYAPPDVQALSPRLLLHACALDLVHPATGAALHVEHAAPF